jgi:hypothetical protein
MMIVFVVLLVVLAAANLYWLLNYIFGIVDDVVNAFKEDM